MIYQVESYYCYYFVKEIELIGLECGPVVAPSIALNVEEDAHLRQEFIFYH